MTTRANNAQSSDTAALCWNIASISDTEGEIILYGPIEESHPVNWWTGEKLSGVYITPETFLKDLELVKGKSKITVKINSRGGDLYTGIAIHNAIKSLNSKIEVIVEGIAASAASVIMCAGDVVKVYPGSLVMIHEPITSIRGYCSRHDLGKIIKMLEADIEASVAIYAEKTGVEADKLRTMMEEETWMTGSDAVSEGFADELIADDKDEGPQASMLGGSVLMIAGVKHSLEGLHLPANMNIPVVSTDDFESNKKGKNAKNEGGNLMPTTFEELQRDNPDLVAQIEQNAADNAVQAERERLQAIEEIAPTIGDAKLVSEAKFTKPCTAAELALAAAKQHVKNGKMFLANIDDDYGESGADDVGATGAGNEDDKPATAEQLRAQGRADAKAMAGNGKED